MCGCPWKKQKQKKMKKNISKEITKNKVKKYIFSILLAFALLMVSLTGPGLLFDMQDHIQVRKTWQGNRNSLDAEMLNASYGDQTERLASFAQGLSEGKKYYASGMDVDLSKEEKYSIIEQALPQYYYANDFTVTDWKKYIILDSTLVDNNTSVVFLTWYIELTGKSEESIKILVDTEDLTVYYIKVDGFTDEDIISKQWYVDDETYKKKSVETFYYLEDYLFEYYKPDLVEYETKDFSSTEIYHVDLFFGNYPLHWEYVFGPYLQIGFFDMRILIPKFEE